MKRCAHLFIAVLSFVSIYFLHAPFPFIVLAAAVTGLVGARLLPESFDAASSKAKKEDAEIEEEDERRDAPAIIDDVTPSPAHTLPSRLRALKIILVGVALWALPFAVVVAWRGWPSLHAQQYRFFTQAAFVTFGGAYAVLAYVVQTAVDYGWVTRAGGDGLALAETTPGPLIMVLQFIGFMAAWSNPQGMDAMRSAITGAALTTYVTFLPCFIFIFLGAPSIERLRGNKKLVDALACVTAAVVGVILNLALVFAATVIFPQG